MSTACAQYHYDIYLHTYDYVRSLCQIGTDVLLFATGYCMCDILFAENAMSVVCMQMWL